MTLSVRPVAV